MNALTGSATTHISIAEQGGGEDHAPVVTAPACWTGKETRTLSFVVTATDPDGDAITSLTASTLPSGAAFTTNASNTSGTFTWIPTLTQSGSYEVTFTASNALSGSATTNIKVRNLDQKVVLAPIGDIIVAAGTTFTINVSATDPDGDHIRITACLPRFAHLNDPREGDGSVNTTITVSPTEANVGVYKAFVRARARCGDKEIERFHITVTPAANGTNTPPTITASTSRTITTGSLFTFEVTATDMNGDAILLTAAGLPTGASFTDNGGGSGSFSWTPTSSQTGTFAVTFTANDQHGGITTSTLTLTVPTSGGAASALVFATGQNGTIRLNGQHDDETTCLMIQPVDGSFDTNDAVLTTLTLRYQGRSLTVDADKAQRGMDENSDEVDEIQVCFTNSELADLFGALPNGESTVTLALGGTLTGGGTFEGTIDQRVVVGGNDAGKGKLHIAAKPNPVNPRTNLSFRLTRAGSVRVDLFDARGRRVRALLAQSLASGPHTIPWDGTNEQGGRVASGSYFFRVQAPEGTQVQRVTVLK